MRQGETLEGAIAARPLRSTSALKIFYAFLVLALLSLALNFGGKWLGRSMAMGGHSDDPTLREIVVGNDVILAPANMIRFAHARRDGVAPRLDLYLRWPDMDGYSPAARDAFNNIDGKRQIIFLSLEERMMSRDMSGRFEPIYSSLIVQPGKPGENGVTIYDFTAGSGYLNEVLTVAARPGKEPFVARCLTGKSAKESLAPCVRDIDVGGNLSLTYRFPWELLAQWPALEAAIIAKAAELLKTGG